ncbi:hypothetical protein [Streptodolium elevatio]
MPELDPVLDAWLIDPAAPPTARPLDAPAEPAETHLLSAQEPGAGGGRVLVTADTLHASAFALQALRAEVQADVQAAVNATADEAVFRGLELAKALEQVQKRWGEKLAHLTSTMDEYVGKLHDNANKWKQADDGNATTLTVI